VTIARHHSTQDRPEDRGVAFGRAQAAAVAHTVATYSRILLVDRGLGPAEIEARGREVEARIRAFRPALADEIEAIAAGAQQSAGALFAINARTELLAGGVIAGGAAGECSTVALLDGEGALLAQNWDFHPDLAGSRVVWTIDLPGGRSLTTFTEAGIVGKVGVSSDGVALAINFLATDVDGGLEGVPIHVLCRALLEEARTLHDARELIAATPVSASVSMTVAGPDAGGVTARAFEVWPGGMAEVALDPERGWIAHTNHFLAAIGARDLLADGQDSVSTHDRLAQLTAALRNGVAADTASVSELLSSRGAPGLEPIYRLDDGDLPWLERCTTLATLAFEVPSGGMWLRGEGAAGAPLERVA
jgi:isopenicillin-N N-acyltransferase like protein